MTDTTIAVADRASEDGLLGHPKGLWVLAGTELWERISFHGMLATLVLYMADALLLPGRIEHVVGFARYRAALESVTGPLSVQALATQTFGLYIGLAYFTPVLGGAIGDRVTGRRGAVVAGGLLMTAGHFALAFDASFLLALLLLIFGAGFLRGNLSAQIRSLYAEGDRRAADAFQLYYIALCTGAFIAPIVTGTLAAVYGWHVGFAFAGVGMLIGLGIYLVGQKHLRRDAPRDAAATRARLTPEERRRLVGLFAFWPLILCFWITQSQIWNVYNLWVRDHIDLAVGSFIMPVPWLQSLDGLAPALLSPCAILWWKWQARRGREPDVFVKLSSGCLIFAGATALLSLAPLLQGADGRAPLLLPIAFHVFSNLGAVFFVPLIDALYASEAPVALRATMMGVSALSIFFASVISGRMGGLYERIAPADFWMINAGIVGAAGVAIVVSAPWFRRRFAGPTGG